MKPIMHFGISAVMILNHLNSDVRVRMKGICEMFFVQTNIHEIYELFLWIINLADTTLLRHMRERYMVQDTERYEGTCDIEKSIFRLEFYHLHYIIV